MRYNTYSNNIYPKAKNAYPRRRPSRFQEPDKIGLGQRLAEALLTQCTICALVTGLIFGAQLLKLPNINTSISKVKTMITYSPSLKEIAKEASQGASSLINKIKSQDQVIDHEEIPIILVDDEIF